MCSAKFREKWIFLLGFFSRTLIQQNLLKNNNGSAFRERYLPNRRADEFIFFRIVFSRSKLAGIEPNLGFLFRACAMRDFLKTSLL